MDREQQGSEACRLKFHEADGGHRAQVVISHEHIVMHSA